MPPPVTLDELSEGDHVLFNNRQQPLTVTKTSGEKVLVEGPQGGEYMLFRAEDDPDTLLVAKPGNREYASYCSDLRRVGTWEKDDAADLPDTAERWTHTDTDATITIEQTDAGNWTLTIENFDGELPDIPGLGYLSKEPAVEDAQKFMRKHADGT